MGRCLFASCKSDTSDRSKTFFRVPVSKDIQIAKLWLTRARRQDLDFSTLHKSAVVCSDHFHPDQLLTEPFGYGTRLRVKEGEIPFANGVTPVAKRQVNVRRQDHYRGVQPTVLRDIFNKVLKSKVK